MLNEDIKEHFKKLCIAANHTLTRSEYRKLNDISEYSSSKIEALWGTWKSFIQDVSSTINLNRYNIVKTVKKPTCVTMAIMAQATIPLTVIETSLYSFTSIASQAAIE